MHCRDHCSWIPQTHTGLATSEDLSTDPVELKGVVGLRARESGEDSVPAPLHGLDPGSSRSTGKLLDKGAGVSFGAIRLVDVDHAKELPTTVHLDRQGHSITTGMGLDGVEGSTPKPPFSFRSLRIGPWTIPMLQDDTRMELPEFQDGSNIVSAGKDSHRGIAARSRVHVTHCSTESPAAEAAAAQGSRTTIWMECAADDGLDAGDVEPMEGEESTLAAESERLEFEASERAALAAAAMAAMRTALPSLLASFRRAWSSENGRSR